jgi:hypothetical protein
LFPCGGLFRQPAEFAHEGTANPSYAFEVGWSRMGLAAARDPGLLHPEQHLPGLPEFFQPVVVAGRR